VSGRRVLVTGASTPLARGVLTRLAGRTVVHSVVGVEARGAGPRRGGGPDTRRLSELVEAGSIDTVVHVAMCPSRSGAPGGDPPDAISTLDVAAAASSRPGSIRTLVAVSSTEVYPATARAPTWRREDESLRTGDRSTADLVLEAEDQLREVARHQPHISVAILRLADVAGPTIGSGLTALLSGVVVPVVPGYDPPVQLLHADDAVRAIEHAVALELAGTFNVASDGIVRWRQAARMIGRRTVPLLPTLEPVSAILRILDVPPVPAELIDVLRFGRCAETAAIAATGFMPEHSTEDCLRALAHRSARRAG
jgi:UDP-glucose 4-epimerase